MSSPRQEFKLNTIICRLLSDTKTPGIEQTPNTLYVFKKLDGEVIAKYNNEIKEEVVLGMHSALSHFINNTEATPLPREPENDALYQRCENFINRKQKEFAESEKTSKAAPKPATSEESPKPATTKAFPNLNCCSPAIPEEERIKKFFGTNFLDGFKGLKAVIESKRQERLSIESMEDEFKKFALQTTSEYLRDGDAIKKFDNLEKILYANTPHTIITPMEAAWDISLLDIHSQTRELKTLLQLTTCGQRAKRFVLQMLDAIVVALGGAYYGAHYGAAAGPYGAIAGGIAGAIVGFYATNKVGTWASHKSSIIAGADHSATLNTEANKRISNV